MCAGELGEVLIGVEEEAPTDIHRVSLLPLVSFRYHHVTILLGI
jgi:hypothetical protein